ncbi:TetR/AcrR family transcriptional regulator [Streptomyces sp. HNM0574]|uniref:TetR/AcrR family transcriptional regulator n=1 Tax=Streptomyces sp. HNM0574 TaxID=2714954 RepID=UPI00146CEDCA|nr:TetR/AcrR family transcriptional regulator [Streptomyces sp. HNM0574]NLU67155.1 TetR/AcrR family transcriptional regulator [Streptomyces sp. HNM0574]
MSSSGTAPAYRRMTVEQRRAQLITTALGLFAHHPPEDISLDGVASAAGVSRPLVYRYFPGGKQQLYEEALRSAADRLELCFSEPQSGPLTVRLSRALDRYLAFVDEHDAGFMALLQGGSVVETSRTHAIVDEVRRTAAEEVFAHLGTEDPGERLRTTVRTWIAAVEAASLIWLDEGKRPPREELREGMVEHFVALLVITGARDDEMHRITLRALEMEEREGPVGDLVRRALPVVAHAGHLL